MRAAREIFEVLRRCHSGEAMRAAIEQRDPTAAALVVMEAFAGREVRMPTMPDVERLSRDLAIVEALNRNPARATVKRLADRFSVEQRVIAKVFAKRSWN